MAVRTWNDIFKYSYGNEDIYELIKADDDVKTTTTGYFTAVAGPKAFLQINEAANTYGALPKVPYSNSKLRLITTDAYTDNTGGIEEGGALPDTDKPDMTTGTITLKEIVHATGISLKQKRLVELGQDDTFGSVDDLVTYMSERHVNQINRMLHTNVTTLAGNNAESLDRVVSSYDEVTNCADVDANDSDIYGMDRDAAATNYDAYVNHNSDTDRSFSLDLLDATIHQVISNGGNPSMIITGPDTAQKIENEVETKVRYDYSRKPVQFLGANGVKMGAGMEAGYYVGVYKGIPIIEDKNVVVDGSSRVYVLDTHDYNGKPALAFEIAEATKVTPLAYPNTNALKDDLYIRTMGELVCRKFPFQAKIRDLSA